MTLERWLKEMQEQVDLGKNYLQELFKEQIGAPPPAYKQLQQQLEESVALRAFFFASLACAVLLVTRPPFVMTFQYDKRKPWRAEASVSWSSLLTFAALSAGVACALPRLLR